MPKSIKYCAKRCRSFFEITELITLGIVSLGERYCVEMTTRITAWYILLLQIHCNPSSGIKRRNMRYFRPNDCSDCGTPCFVTVTHSNDSRGVRRAQRMACVESSTQIPALATTVVGIFIISVVKSPCDMKILQSLPNSRNSLINSRMVGIPTYICLTVMITDRVISFA